MSALSLRTDAELHQDAVDLAKRRAYWLRRADVGSAAFTRRQCLRQARGLEELILNIAIHVEAFRCRGEVRS